MRNSSDDAAPGGVIVIHRITKILEAFSEESPELGIADLVRRTGLSGSTVHRLVGSLDLHGFLDHTEARGKYRLGLRLFQLGQLAMSRVSYVDLAADALAALAKETGETVHMGILRNGLAVYIAKVEGWRSLRLPSQVGREVSPHCTAVGKCLLAFSGKLESKRIVDRIDFVRHTPRTICDRSEFEQHLTTVRANGYAQDQGEYELELSCVSAPILDHSGRVVAAISISGPSQRFCTIGTEYVDAVVRTARQVSRKLGTR